MTTSLITYESRISDWLLDLLYAQWRALGTPLSAAPPASGEVIDPEALLWCSLEFFPTQPRLCEQVLGWLARNDEYLLRPRVRKLARDLGDPRTSIWQVLDPEWKVAIEPPSRCCYGQNPAEPVSAFTRDLGWRSRQAGLLRQQPGTPESAPTTLILRARDALGADAKHFILVYLLGTGGGARLRSIAQWSGQSYRNISKTAQRWEAAKILTLEHGHARLRNLAVWSTLLEIDTRDIVLLDWLRLYEACLKLLRSLAKAGARSLPADGPVVASLLREARTSVSASVEGQPLLPSETVRSFTRMLLGLPAASAAPTTSPA